MKIKKIILGLFLLMSLFMFSSCSKNDNVVINTKENQTSIVLFESELDSFSFNNIFVIKVNDKEIDVKDEYIDTSKIDGVGKFIVSCNYKDVVKNIQVTIREDVYSVNSTTEFLKLYSSEVDGYDFTSLFSVSKNGNFIEVSNDMLVNEVSNIPGDYYVSLSLKDAYDKVLVRVEEDYDYSCLTVSAKNENVEILDEDVENFDITSLFNITYKDNAVKVKEEYISGSISKEVGVYPLTLTYNTKSVTVNVSVRETSYELILDEDEINLNYNQVTTFDFLSLFTLKREGKEIDKSNVNITSNVKTEVGTYYYTVSYKNTINTLTVNVNEIHTIDIIKSYKEYSLTLDELDDFDYTCLFSVYVDSNRVNISNDNIDLTNLNEASEGNSYEISISYTAFDQVVTNSIKINIIKLSEYVVNTVDKTVYVNDDALDLTTLFEIKLNDENIEINNENISGSVNYNEVGDYEVSLLFNSNIYTATVHVIKGLKIDYRTTSCINIPLNTNIDSYDFANDFIIYLNNTEVKNIPLSYFDFGSLDFNIEGEYNVKLSLPLCTKISGGIRKTYVYDTITKEIIYNVVKYDGIVKLIDEEVILENDSSYDVTNNIKCFVNERKMVITTNKSYANYMSSVYGEIIQDFDPNIRGRQEIIIDVYCNGLNLEPVRLSYYIINGSSYIVNAIDQVVFSGSSIYTKDLFSVQLEDGTNVEFDNDFIEGYINNNVPGVYEIKINYYGYEAISKVTVLNKEIIGTYLTDLSTVGSEQSDPDEEGYYYDEEVASVRLGNMTIDENLKIVVNGKIATKIKCIDSNNFTFYLGSYLYYVNIDNGIITLNPDNSLSMTFTDSSKRPLVYFNSSIYSIKNKLVINSLSKYIIGETSIGCSYDVFFLQNKITNEEFNYAMYVKLYSAYSADYKYIVEFDRCLLDEDFDFSADISSSISFKGENYSFKMIDSGNGKLIVNDNISTYVYKNKVFTGQIDGINSSIVFNQYGHYSINLGNKEIFTASTYDINSHELLGVNKEGLLIAYEYDEKTSTGSYFYAFELDITTNKFTQVDLDSYQGLYKTDDSLIVLDGTGHGYVKPSSSSYYTYYFTYSSIDNNTLKFVYNSTTDYSLEIGSSVIVKTDYFHNSLTYLNDEFAKQTIIDGAVIKITTNIIYNTNVTDNTENFLNSVCIITSDGEITDNATKKAMMDLSLVSFTKAGFYQYSISVNYNSQVYKLYYGLQIVDAIIDDSPLVNLYTNSVFLNGCSLQITKFGLVRITYNNEIYEGFCKVIDNNTMYANIKNSEGKNTLVNIKLIENGIIKVTSSGLLSINDYFSVKSILTYSNDFYCFRTIRGTDNNIYLLSNNVNSIGNICSIEVLSGDDYNIDSIININNSLIIRLSNNSLLEVSDGLYGTYTNEENNIFVNGFNIVNIQNESFTYTKNGNTIYIIKDKYIYTYSLNKNDYTYTLSVNEINLDNLIDKTFSASYSFYCGYSSYNAQTTFNFKDNNVVEISSLSDDHDDTSGCEDDKYSPLFIGSGTYSFANDYLKIIINDITFNFSVDNITDINKLTLVDSTLEYNSHGYIKVNQTFISC